MKFILETANRVRSASNGWTWYHFPCPFCRERGVGADHSQHLGIGVRGDVFRVRCFRCGVSKLPRGTNVSLGGRSLHRGQSRQSQGVEEQKKTITEVVTELPGSWLGSLSQTSISFASFCESLSVLYPHLSVSDLIQAGIRVPDTSLGVFYFPFWSEHGEGYVIRFLNQEPKTKQHGPSCVGYLHPVDFSENNKFVVVEGWSDAAAIPFPYVPLILFGATKELEPLPMKGEFYLALDNDDTGRKATRRCASHLLRKGRKVHLVEYSGKDPADAGKAVMMEGLHIATPLSTVKDLLNVTQTICGLSSPGVPVSFRN